MPRVQIFFDEPSLTKQSFKDECDINVIMQRFKKVCGSDFLNRYSGYLNGSFGDFSSVTDYRSAIDQIQQARGVFEALPAKVRARFENDPAAFLDFVKNPANRDELVGLGLIDPKVGRPGDQGKGPDQDPSGGISP